MNWIINKWGIKYRMIRAEHDTLLHRIVMSHN